MTIYLNDKLHEKRNELSFSFKIIILKSGGILLCDEISDSSLKNVLFTEHLHHFKHDIQVENFCNIFLRKYKTRISENWFQIHHPTTSC